MNNHIDQNRCRYRYGHRHGHRHRYSCRHGLCLHFASGHIHPSLLMIGTNSQQVNKAVCCSVLQCVAVRCSAVRCSVSQRVAACHRALQSVAVYRSLLQCVAVCCLSTQQTPAHTIASALLQWPPFPPSHQTPYHIQVPRYSRKIRRSAGGMLRVSEMMRVSGMGYGVTMISRLLEILGLFYRI